MCVVRLVLTFFADDELFLFAGAKTGKEIRDYATQRIASNMVFLSLLLNATMGVLMNSAHFAVEIRASLQNQMYLSTKYWIACTLIMDACVTVMALVTNFTAWGLLSSISDNNAHAILRSSMGQYSVALPSRYVVVSLYLFLLWLILLVTDLVSGPFCVALVGVVVCMFLHAVVSLSAFGRLIIFTGAMGKRHILEPEMERNLMPSGLHAVLLIAATERKRRGLEARDQYKDGNASWRELLENADGQSDAVEGELERPTDSPRKHYGSTGQELGNSGRSELTSDSLGISFPHNKSVGSLTKEIHFPRLSVLNRAIGGNDLKEVVKMALERNAQIDDMDSLASAVASDIESPFIEDEETSQKAEGKDERAKRRTRSSLRSIGRSQRSAIVCRGSMAERKLGAFLRSQRRETLRQELLMETDIRDMYGIEPLLVPQNLHFHGELHSSDGSPQRITRERDRSLSRTLDIQEGETDPLFP